MLKISCVSYLNSLPFALALQKHSASSGIELSLDLPADCARKLESGQVDIGLIPVAKIHDIPNANLVSNYCIGAENRVRTVVIASNQPIQEIDTLYLDPQSHSSNKLAKILIRDFWKCDLDILPREDLIIELEDGEAAVFIGDKVFEIEKKHPYIYDLAETWNKLHQLPFVFAAWVANKSISQEETRMLNSIFEEAIINIEGLQLDVQKRYPTIDINDYFTKNISFRLDNDKRKALKMFINETV